LGPLERANLNHDPVSETSCFYSEENRTMEKVKKKKSSNSM
jgi:hypothetical protein